jgi:hypothetical protein
MPSVLPTVVALLLPTLSSAAMYATPATFAPAPRGPTAPRASRGPTTPRPPPHRRGPTEDFVREAEKKHARVALLAAPTLAALPMLTGDPDAASYLLRQPVEVQLTFFSAAGLVESYALARLGPGFSLRKGVVPGVVPPLRPPSPDLDAVEDTLGRGAMLATTAMLLVSVLA